MSSLSLRFRSGFGNIHWARVVSDLLSPPVIWAVLAFPIAFHVAETQSDGILWAMIYGMFVCWLPVIYIAWNVRAGKITDIHIQVRRQRIRPFIVTITGALIACGALVLINAPRLMPLFALFSLLQITVMTLITFVWQISMHTMSITGAVVAAGALYGVSSALALAPLVLLVGAARVKLRRHTFAQVIAGAAVGASMTALLFTLV